MAVVLNGELDKEELAIFNCSTYPRSFFTKGSNMVVEVGALIWKARVVYFRLIYLCDRPLTSLKWIGLVCYAAAGSSLLYDCAMRVFVSERFSIVDVCIVLRGSNGVTA